jgi:hypothetical protein
MDTRYFITMSSAGTSHCTPMRQVVRNAPKPAAGCACGGKCRTKPAPPKCSGCEHCRQQATNAPPKPASYWTAAYERTERRLDAATNEAERGRLTMVLDEIRHAERAALAREGAFRGKLFSLRAEREGWFRPIFDGRRGESVLDDDR